MSKIEKYATLLADIEYLGFKISAEKLANNNGIKLLCQSEGTTSKSIAPAIKKALEDDLLQFVKEYKNGIFRRVDANDEEKESAIQVQRSTDHMFSGSIADLDFMKRMEPKISER